MRREIENGRIYLLFKPVFAGGFEKGKKIDHNLTQ